MVESEPVSEQEPVKEPMPQRVVPMRVRKPKAVSEKPGWYYEIKYNGWRAITYVENGRVRLHTKGGVSLPERFPEVVKDLQRIGGQAVFDGELVVFDEENHQRPGWLNRAAQKRKGTLVYFVFDLLHLDGYNLRRTPLRDRKEALNETLLPDLPHVRAVPFRTHLTGEEFFRGVRNLEFEGMVIKNPAGLYYPGRKSRDWLAIKP